MKSETHVINSKGQSLSNRRMVRLMNKNVIEKTHEELDFCCEECGKEAKRLTRVGKLKSTRHAMGAPNMSGLYRYWLLCNQPTAFKSICAGCNAKKLYY